MMLPSRRFQEIAARVEKDEAWSEELAQLADAGDPHASFMLGEFRIFGMHGPRDSAAGYGLIARAAEQGLIDAGRAIAYLTAQGIGHEPNFETARAMLAALAKVDRFTAIQLAVLNHVDCGNRLHTAEQTVVSEDPRVVVFHELFSSEECRYLRIVKEPMMSPAVVGSGSDLRRHPHRDSDYAAFGPLTEDLVVQQINRCIAEATGTEASWGEPLGVLRYSPGQQYRLHHDAVRPADPAEERSLTALIWLNDEYEGGETIFPKLGLTIRGAVGDMIVFRNVLEDGSPDPRMQHAGVPVKRGTKWLASRWIRSKPYLAS